jgi:hypothetical protein
MILKIGGFGGVMVGKNGSGTRGWKAQGLFPAENIFSCKLAQVDASRCKLVQAA